LVDVQRGFVRAEVADCTYFAVIRPLRVSIRPMDGRKGFIAVLWKRIFPIFAPKKRMVEREDKALTRTSETTRTDEFGSPPRWRF